MPAADPGRTPPRPRLCRRPSGLRLCQDPGLEAMIEAAASAGSWGALSTAGLSDEQVDSLRRSLARQKSARWPLHPLLPASLPVQTLRVASYREKDLAVASLADWSASTGLPRRLVAALEQAVDELLLNALFDAPCDAGGRPRYETYSAQQRLLITALPGEEAELRYAADSQRVVVGVRDSFGRLPRSTVIDYFRRCAAAQAARISPLEQKAGGSGVGLYLVLSAASELLFRLHEGHSTEVVFTVYRQRPYTLRALCFEESTGRPRAEAEASALAQRAQ